MRTFFLGLTIVAIVAAAACDHSGFGAASPGGPAPSFFDARAVPDVAHHYRAGTRLKPRWHVTSDGARELVGIRDTQLAIDCKFLPTPDGLRCVPNPSADETLTDTATSFRDVSCNEPAAWGVAAAMPKFIVAHPYLETDCPETKMRVYRAENARRVGALYHRYANQSCGGKTEVSGGIATATRGVEVTAMLVRGKRVVAGAASPDFGGLAVAYIEADDGAVLFDSWVDPKLNAQCTFTLAADGVVRCLPHGIRTTYFFEKTCTSAGATTRCGPPSFIVESDAKCSERTHVLRVGASKPGSYWLKSDVDCIQQTINSSGTTTYASAGEIAPAQLTAAASAKDASNRRLRANVVAVGSYRAISVSASAPWRDTKLDVDCRFAPAADGVERCLPWTAVRHVDAFSDGQCTSESRPAYVGVPVHDTCASTAAEATPIPRYIRSLADRPTERSMIDPEPPLRVRVDEIGAWPQNVPLYVQRNRACAAIPATELASMGALIGEVAPAAFEAARESIE